MRTILALLLTTTSLPAQVEPPVFFSCDADVIANNPVFDDWVNCQVPAQLTFINMNQEVQFLPQFDDQHFGARIVFGDWNGDEILDAAVSGRRAATAGSGFASVWIYVGPFETAADWDAPVLTIVGDGERDQFGDGTTFIRDMNNDGCAELAVGAPNWPNISRRSVGRSTSSTGAVV